MFHLLSLLSLVALTLANPLPTPAPDAGSIVNYSATCTFSGSNGAASASASQASCSTIVLSNVAVPAGKTLDLSNLNDGTKIIFKGKTTWSYAEWTGPLLQIKGTRITVHGAHGATLNPDGSRWWDGLGGNGGKIKPKFFAAHDLTDSLISNIHILNTPVQAVSINGCEGLVVERMVIDNSAGDREGGHNTDGFDIGVSNGVTIRGAKVWNQDDCVAVNSGTNITFTSGFCSGSHGLSIGSVGGRDDNTVKNVTFSHSTVTNSTNGIRIKASVGETGSVSDVTYSGITLNGIKDYGILIEQNYDGGDLRGEPSTGIPITDFTLENISGAGGVDSEGYNVAIVCGEGACKDWTWRNVTVSGGQTYGECKNVPRKVGGC